MATVVRYPGGEIDLPLDAPQLVMAWEGPKSLDSQLIAERLATSLGSPIDFPPLIQAVVPGDQILVVIDPNLPEPSTVLSEVVACLGSAAVDKACIRIAISSGSGDAKSVEQAVRALGLELVDPSDFAYLATTADSRRVYLNRAAIDADFVLPIGVISGSESRGWRGPWSVLDPGLTNEQARAVSDPMEVAWLLGNQFQIGVIPGVDGISSIVSGLAAAVHREVILQANRQWKVCSDRRADLVVLGLGAGSGLDATWSAFATGSKLVRRGGKIVVLSDASGSIGAATERLVGADRFDSAETLLANCESAPDYAAAKHLKEALDWADLYLFSRLDADVVEDLGIVVMQNPREVRRLAESAIDVTVVNHAEWTLAGDIEDES